MEIFFSVGEPSGDQHASHLIHELRKRSPELKFTGYGGPEMQAAGCDIHFQLTDMAVMGILPIIPLLGKFIRLMKQADRYFQEHRPDAVVLVDFPGFNWWIARKAKAAGIPVFYYLPPQLWAWASWRIKRIRKYVDYVLSGLPFERDWYAERGVDVDYVGHPFFDEVAAKELDAAFCLEQRSAGKRIVGLLPGSRGHEVRHNFEDMLRLAETWSQRHPDVRFLVACYKDSQRDVCQQMYRDSGTDLPIEFHVGRTSEIVELSECCLMVSGSVSLELLARKTPAVVTYRCSPMFYIPASLLVRIKYFTLPNLFADRMVYPEFYHLGRSQKKLPEMEAIVDRWLSDPEELARKREEISELHRETVRPGALGLTAETILSRLPAASARRAA